LKDEEKEARRKEREARKEEKAKIAKPKEQPQMVYRAKKTQ